MSCTTIRRCGCRTGRAEFTWTTYPERLKAADVSWKFYHEANTATGLPTLTHFTQ
jgi:phospholipase C